MDDLLCNDTLRARLAAHLAAHRRTASGDARLRRSAVALVVVDSPEPPGVPGFADLPPRPERASFLLTRRAAGLSRHRGQWALPGGRIDPGEDAVAAALRELTEEVGLALDRSAVLGLLDDYPTRSGFAITPVVVWGGRVPALEPDPAEVASVHRIPLRELYRPDAPELRVVRPGEAPVLRMPVGELGGVFAPTGAILYQFREVALEGRPTRVAHFEAPDFARR
ncbi:MAG: putative MutT/NUDIX family protein [Porticoccaceae bacterium]|nr:MAG: putative MutT/NUDIX family protein [Porticoccaceae bacterium]